jgi:archaellum component FlaG (FlaF/FlaG flagellin family)
MISSNRDEADNTSIQYITDFKIIGDILNDKEIIKLHYQDGAKAGFAHKNWGKVKGEDHHQDVCVLLNKKTAAKRKVGALVKLAPSTKNKLYVALTRARGNVYLIDE